MTKAEEAFQAAFGGQPNFVTDQIVYQRMVGRYAVELSWGEMEPLLAPGQRMWGVTVLNPDGTRPEGDLSRPFHDEAEAQAYIDELEEGDL